MAGLTVAIVALPLSMAIAIASGTMPERGLYISIVGGFFVSAFGGSRFQIGGPAGAFIVLVAATDPARARGSAAESPVQAEGCCRTRGGETGRFEPGSSRRACTRIGVTGSTRSGRMAEGVGFEPTRGLHPCRFSRPVP